VEDSVVEQHEAVDIEVLRKGFREYQEDSDPYC
jgi:hypothetical protein